MTASFPGIPGGGQIQRQLGRSQMQAVAAAPKIEEENTGMSRRTEHHHLTISLSWMSDSPREDVDQETLDTMRRPLEDIVRDLLDCDADDITYTAKIEEDS